MSGRQEPPKVDLKRGRLSLISLIYFLCPVVPFATSSKAYTYGVLCIPVIAYRPLVPRIYSYVRTRTHYYYYLK